MTEFAEALTVSCEGRARELRDDRPGTDWPARVELLSGRMATTFELPCRLGGRLGGASVPVINALASYGRHLGVSYALADELRAATGDSRWDHPGSRSARIPPPGGPPVPADPARLAELGRLVEEHAWRAREALDRVPDGPARDLLRRLTELTAAGAGRSLPGQPGYGLTDGSGRRADNREDQARDGRVTRVRGELSVPDLAQ